MYTWQSGIPDPPATAGKPEANGHAHENSSGAAEVKGDLEPKSSQEWVELLVQQMAGAKDLDDARSRASQILQAFEQAVLQQAAQVRTPLQTVSHIAERLWAQHPQTLVGTEVHVYILRGPTNVEMQTSTFLCTTYAGSGESRGS